MDVIMNPAKTYLAWHAGRCTYLSLAIIFSLFLLAGCMLVTGHITYIFLVWNLFLALVPCFISHYIVKRFRQLPKKQLIITVICWVLFLPNSFYIVTDLFHLDAMSGAPQWFDLLLIFSFAWNGLLAGFLSLRTMEKLVRLFSRPSSANGFVGLVLWLCSLGVYIGRYLRFNSWDILVQPIELISEVSFIFIHPFQHGQAWAMVFGYTLFNILLYFTIIHTRKTV